MSAETTKALLDLAIRALGFIIPALGSLIGTPIVGWLLSIVMSFLTGMLQKLIDRKIDFALTDEKVKAQFDAAKLATEDLKKVQNDPTASVDQKLQSRTAFKDALRKLTHNDGL